MILDERLWKQFSASSKAKYYQEGQQIIIGDIREQEGEQVPFQDLHGETLLQVVRKGGMFDVVKGEKYKESRFTFACVHLGILDKLSSRLHTEVDSLIDALNQTEICEHLIIHSGRGKTLKSRLWVLYMDYSSLQTWLKEGKVLLIQGLYSLRPFRPEVRL
jgi:hypothetical protein